MNDYVEYLLGEQKNDNGILLEVLESGYEEWEYIVALEGKDDKVFYYDYLSDYLETDKIWMIDCGGKQALLGFKGSADAYQWAPRPRILYICDKDFDDYLNAKKEGIFYTDKYSIENYLASAEYLTYVLQKHSKGQLKPLELEAFKGSFIDTLGALTRRVAGYCAYMCAIREGDEHPAFDDFGIEHLFALNDARCPHKPNKKRRAEAILVVQKQPSRTAVRRWMSVFLRDDPSKWLRGKLALQLAKKSYELVKRATGQGVRSKLPDDIKMNREGFAGIRNLIPHLPGLKEYCIAM